MRNNFKTNPKKKKNEDHVVPLRGRKSHPLHLCTKSFPWFLSNDRHGHCFDSLEITEGRLSVNSLDSWHNNSEDLFIIAERKRSRKKKKGTQWGDGGA